MATDRLAASSNQVVAAAPSSGGFIRVLYGNGQALLCNIDCSSMHLLHYIRDKCAPDLSPNALDLCNEKGRLVDFTSAPDAFDLFVERADDILRARTTYILLNVRFRQSLLRINTAHGTTGPPA